MGDILRRTYSITNWVGWDDEVHAAVQEFRVRFRLAPNILLTTEATYARIDMVAKKKKLSGPNGEPASENEYTPISIFTGPDYELEFCVDDALPTSRFSLIWDDDPSGGDGEDVPDEDTEDVDWTPGRMPDRCIENLSAASKTELSLVVGLRLDLSETQSPQRPTLHPTDARASRTFARTSIFEHGTVSRSHKREILEL